MTNQDNIATQIEQIAMSHFAGANITDFVVEEYDEDEMSGVLIIELQQMPISTSRKLAQTLL